MNTPRPTIPLKVASGKPSKEALAQLDKHWRVQYLMLAPHRLSFFLAMVVLVASALWWGAVQVDRATGWRWMTRIAACTERPMCISKAPPW